MVNKTKEGQDEVEFFNGHMIDGGRSMFNVKEAWIDGRVLAWACVKGSKLIFLWFKYDWGDNDYYEGTKHNLKVPEVEREGGAYGYVCKTTISTSSSHGGVSLDEIHQAERAIREFLGEFDFGLYCERRGMYDYGDAKRNKALEW